MSRRRRFRAALLALLLLPGLVYFALYAYIVAWTGMTVGQALPRVPVCLLFVLVAANALLRGPLRRWRLDAGELRLVYALTAVGLATCGVGYALSIVPTLGGGLVYYSAVVHPDWAAYLDHVPPWAMVRDREVVDRFFLGHSTLYRADHLRALATPVLAWTGIVGLLIAAQFCLGEWLRRQWIRRERLTFPLVHLPLAMSESDGRFWRNGLMWSGFALAALLNLINGLHHLYPAVPEIRLKPIRTEPFTQPPWSGVGVLYPSWYPFVIGIGYLLSTDVSLSLWLFYVLAKLQMVAAVALGFRADGGFPSPSVPYLPSQGTGAFVALGLFALWRVRPLLAGAWRGRGEIARWAVVGLPLAFGGLVWACAEAGVPPALAALWVGLLLIMTVAVARLVAEAGAPLAMVPVYPQQVLYDTLPGAYGPRDWAALSLFRNVDELYTDAVTIHTLSGHRLLERDDERASLSALFALAAAAGLLAGIWALSDIYFRHGIMNVKATWPDRTQAQNPWLQLSAWLQAGPVLDARTRAIGVGSLVTAAPMWLRHHLVWWPLHPIGYAVAGSYAIQQLALPLLVAWGLKVATLRAGGLRLYRRLLPAALGLILGDIVVPQVWTIVGVVLDQPMYFSFPT